MKSILLAISLFFSQATPSIIDPATLVPDWFKQYKHHERRLNHMHMKYLVLGVRLKVSMDICKDRNCYIAAHEAWKPAMTLSAKMYHEVRQMDYLLYKHCGIGENIPTCITMLKHRFTPAYGGNYSQFFGNILLMTKELDRIQREELIREEPRLDQPGMSL